MDTIRDFLKDLFTLRTVWIDRGQGRWSVKKRLHPLLRGMIGTLVLIAVAVVYSEIHTPASVEAETKPTVVTASLPKAAPAPTPAFTEPTELPEPVPAIAPEPVPEIMPLVFPEPAEETQPIVVPVKTQTRSRVTLPSDSNPNTDRIIPPVKPKPKTKTRTDTLDSRPRDTLMRPERMPNPSSGKYSIHISKRTYTLTLMRDGEPVKEYGIAVGKNTGDKQRVGDCRTPTGNFKITMIQDASTWTHDFHDGKGKIKGAYGPWFLRLDAKGWQGIGIHGTHDPNSIGTNATEGCIRLANKDIAELRRYAYRHMPVIVSEL